MPEQLETNSEYRGARAQAATKLRVTLIVHGFPSIDDPISGIFNLRAAQGLSRFANITVVHLRGWRPGRAWSCFSEVEGVSVCRLAMPQIPRFRRRNIELFRRLGWPSVRPIVNGCDLIHSVGGSFASLIATEWARISGRHHVIQITSEVEVANNARRATAEEMKYVHAVACNSAALASRFLTLYPSARNVRAVYRGVNLRDFSPGIRTDSHGCGARFLFLGGFPEYRMFAHGRNTKGGETLLAAWRAAEKELPESALLTIAGPQSTSPDVEKWRAALLRPQNVRLIGAVNPDAIPSHIRESDALLVPSLQEGLPNVVLEAAACGRAVLASRLAGTVEVVVDGETGILLPAGDVHAWRSGLVRLSTNPERLLTIGRSARRHAELYFDSNRYPTEMIELYVAALREPLVTAGIA